MTNIIILALIGGIAISVALSIIGNFVVWRKLSYISDAISHSSILGVVVGIIFTSSADIFILVVCFLFSLLIVFLHNKFDFSKDSLLVSITQFCLALGAILFSLFNKYNTMPTFFFGNLLGLNIYNIITICLLSLFVLCYVIINWNTLILLSINSTIAKAEGIKTNLQDMAFMFLLSSTIAYAIKFAGILLVPSLVIIPALVASVWSKTPLMSIIYSFIISIVSLFIGIGLSTIIDASIGPLITLSLISLLLISLLYKTLRLR